MFHLHKDFDAMGGCGSDLHQHEMTKGGKPSIHLLPVHLSRGRVCHPTDSSAVLLRRLTPWPQSSPHWAGTDTRTTEACGQRTPSSTCMAESTPDSQLTLLRMISGARYSGVPHRVQVRPFTLFANPKSVTCKRRKRL